MAAPPVVKFLDFGQYKYELTKREKENKRRQRSVTFKEVRLSPKIGTGDFDTKVHRAIEFLEDGDRIKVTVRFRGRELTHPELGRNMLARFIDRIKEHGVAERTPLLEGKSMHLTVASVHKPKEHEAPTRTRPAEGAPETEAAEAPAEAEAVTAPAEATPAEATPAEAAPAKPAADAAPAKSAAAAAKPAAAKPVKAAEPVEAEAPVEPEPEPEPVAVAAAAAPKKASNDAAPVAAARASDPSGPQAPAATRE
jgi:translation initiation factor IF-3